MPRPLPPLVTLSSTADAPVLSVVVPAYQCADVLRECLRGLRASDLPASLWELIVVDDGSSDGATSGAAHEYGAHVIRVHDGPRGPAHARNRGAELVRSTVIVFVDADVVVGTSTLTQFLAAFTRQPDTAAVFGSYDAQPRDAGFISQYRNLVHHWVHQGGAGLATTFWTGCGAVRTSPFVTVGGFDAARFRRPQVEDIDLGYRLTDRGFRIVLDPQIQATHLKRWTLRGMLRVDLLDRAIPWMQLLRARGALRAHGTLNLRLVDKGLTMLTAVGLALLMAGIGLQRAGLLWASLVGFGVVVLANAALFLWFARIRGPVFALGTVPLRLAYYGVCAVGGAIGLLTAVRDPVGVRSATAGLPEASSGS